MPNQAVEQICLESLRELLSLVVTNTKKEMSGKKGNFDRESKLLAKHVEAIIGRKPDALTLKSISYS